MREEREDVEFGRTRRKQRKWNDEVNKKSSTELEMEQCGGERAGSVLAVMQPEMTHLDTSRSHPRKISFNNASTGAVQASSSLRPLAIDRNARIAWYKTTRRSGELGYEVD